MSHSTILHRVVRPGVRCLVDTGVTPNQVTTLRLFTGLLAAGGFARGTGSWPDLGAGLLLVSMLLDRADGELARQTGQFSRLGSRYDLISDGLSTMAIFVGMGIGERISFGLVSLAYGLIAAVGVLALFLLMRAFEPAEGVTPKVRPFDPDDALLIVPVLVWSGLMGWTVLATAVVTPAVTVVLGLLLLYRRAVSDTHIPGARRDAIGEGR